MSHVTYYKDDYNDDIIVILIVIPKYVLAKLDFNWEFSSQGMKVSGPSLMNNSGLWVIL